MKKIIPIKRIPCAAHGLLPAAYFLLTTAFLLLTITNAFSQWTSDPGSPQVVCNEDNTRSNVQSHPDGNGGVFVFWLDKRFDISHSDVFGQHYSSEGVALWENDGREILNYTANIFKYTTFRNEANGDLFIASHTTGSLTTDSLLVRKLNTDGSAVWAEDLAVSELDGCNGPTYILSLLNMQITVTNDNYALVYEATLCGGYTQLYLNAFNTDGQLLTPYYGIAIVGGTSWSVQPTYDTTGDIFLSSIFFDNGYEAQLVRLGMDGVLVFPGVNMTSGPTSLYYMYRILSDEDGVTFLWVAQDNNIYARRYDNTGNQLWDDATLNICIADGVQDAFYMQLLGDEMSVVWRDGRPGVVGNAAIYAQRFNLNGELLWQQNGIEVADLNTYVAYPKFAFNNNGDMIVVHTSNVTGMTAHKVLDDSTVQWGTSGIVQCNTTFNQGAEDFIVIPSGENIIMAWQNSTFQNEIYISRVYPHVTEIAQNITACDSIFINDVAYTQSGTYTIELPGDSLLILDLEIIAVEATATLQGDVLVAENEEGNFAWINCDTGLMVSIEANTYTPFETGNYAVIVEQSGCIDTSNCVFVNVIGVEEWNKNIRISLYPNPVMDELNIKPDLPLENVSIALYDAQGHLISSLKNLSFELYNLDIQSLARGMYNVVMRDAERHYTTTFIKQ